MFKGDSSNLLYSYECCAVVHRSKTVLQDGRPGFKIHSGQNGVQWNICAEVTCQFELLTESMVVAAMCRSGSLFVRWLISIWHNGSKEAGDALKREMQDKYSRGAVENQRLTLEHDKLKALCIVDCSALNMVGQEELVQAQQLLELAEKALQVEVQCFLTIIFEQVEIDCS